LLLLLGRPAALDGQDQPRATALTRALLQAAKRTYEGFEKDYYEGFGSQERLYIWSRRWFRAQTEAEANDAEHLAAAEGHLARMKRLEQVTKKRVDARVATVPEYPAATYYRLRAERAVERLKKKER